MKIVVRGGGFSNKGAEAMLLTVHREMLKRFSCVETVATIPSGSHDKAYVNGITPVSIVPEGRLSQLLGSRWTLMMQALRAGHKCKDVQPFFQTAPKAACELQATYPFDAVIDISGFSYSDECGGYARPERLLCGFSFVIKKTYPISFFRSHGGRLGSIGWPILSNCLQQRLL